MTEQEQNLIASNGGTMTAAPVFDFSVTGTQYVYLDFDGAAAQYNNADLGLDIDVEVEDSQLDAARIAAITKKLNEDFADRGVIFTTDISTLPDAAEYSTVYIGKNGLGYAGLAETIDSGNQIKNDEAFVNLSASDSDDAIVATVSHEIEHLVFGLDHGGEGLAAYAASDSVILYSSGTLTGSAEIMSGETLANGGNDSMYVSSGGTATETTVSSDGSMYVSDGGTATKTTLDGGNMAVYGGGTATKTTVSNGSMYVHGTATETTVSSGYMYVSSGGTATSTTVNNGGAMIVSSGGTATKTTLDGGMMRVSSGGTATSTTVNIFGWMHVFNGGTVTSTSFNNGGGMTVSSGGTATSNTVSSGGMMYVYGTATSTSVSSGGMMIVYGGGTVSGTLQIESGAVVSAYSGTKIDFTVAEQKTPSSALITNWDLIGGGSNASYSITVNTAQTEGTYCLATGAADFSNSITIRTTENTEIGSISVGGTIQTADDIIYKLNRNDDNALVFTVTHFVPDPVQNPVGSETGLSWDVSGTRGYVVEYSTDNFAHGIRLDVMTNGLDSLCLPSGTYQWRVKATGGEEWTNGEKIVSTHDAGTPQLVQAASDGNPDIFFANANSVWTKGYEAKNVGSIGSDWAGTAESVAVGGKNRFADIFEGSDDANILYLTDSANGDALFMDDIFTGLPDTVLEQQSRLANIDEIRAGAGSDVIDLTSKRYAYTGDGLTIRGGAGNDTIWANQGENFLFGDTGNDRLVGASGNDVLAGGAGNDSMHGGGGNDIFTFGANWGCDLVQQSDGGSVTLWFESGEESHWNASSMTYSDGVNRVKVSGVAASQVTLKFGDDGSEQFDSLTSLGAFADCSTEKIFEDQNKGILASL